MKKLIIRFAVVVLALASIVSCSKDKLSAPKEEIKAVSFKVSSTIDPTVSRTYIEEDGQKYLTHWSSEAVEKLGLLFDTVEENSTSTTFNALDIANDIATFYGTATLSLGSHTFHPFYPASAFNKAYKTGKIGLTLAATQHPLATTFDPAADIMIGKDQEITVVDENSDGNPDEVLVENLVFTHPMAFIRLHLLAKDDQAKAYGETVTSAEMIVADKTLTGNLSYTPGETLPEIDENSWNTSNSSVKAVYAAANNNANQVLIDLEENGNNNSVYLIVNPITLTEGTTITFNIETDVHSGLNKISRQVTVPAGGMEFLAGAVTELGVGIRDKDVPDVVADTRILVEGFDNVSSNKTQPAANTTGVYGTGVSNNLSYSYSTGNTNIRINSNGQSSDNPYLYINEADQYLTISNIVVDNQTNLDFTAKVKNAATLTLKYKESSSAIWSTAGTYTGTSSFGNATISFVIANTVESLDLQLVGSAALIVDDIVLAPGSEKEQVATPTFSVDEGSYDSAQSVEIACSTDGATIHYTLDGNNPTASSSVYSSAINVSTTTTIKAIAMKSGMTDSEIASATYTISSGSSSGTYYTKVTGVAGIVSGNQYVLVGSTGEDNFALPVEPTLNSGKITGTAVTITSNGISDTDVTGLLWTLTKSGDYYSLGDGSGFLYHSNGGASGTNLGYGNSASYLWNITAAPDGSNGTFKFAGVVSDVVKDRGMLVTTAGQFGGYALSNITGSGYCGIDLYTLSDGKSGAEISYSPASSTITYGATLTQPTLSNTHNLAVSYASSDSDVATVAANGNIAVVGCGAATITCSWEEQTISSVTYRAGSATYSLTVNKIPVTVAFSDPTTAVAVGSTVTNVASTTPSGLAITYSSSATGVATVTSAGVVTGVANGNATITASYAGDATHEAASANYQITVGSANDGSLAHPYTVAEALQVCEALSSGSSTPSNVYVSGIVTTETKTYFDNYHSLTYFISDDGSTTNQLEVYSGKYLSSANFTSAEQLTSGSEVIVCGKLKNYNSTYEFDYNNYLYSVNGVTVLPTITKTNITGVSADGVNNVTTTVSFENNDGWNVSVTPDGSIVTAASITGTTITYSVDANSSNARSGSITVTLSRNGFLDVSVDISVAQDAGANAPILYTYSFTINEGDFTTASYADNNKEHSSTAVCTTDNTKTLTVSWTSNQVYQNSSVMQWQKSNGYIYNNTDLGTIKSVTVNTTAGSFTTYYGTSEHPTSGTTVGNGYFTIKTGSSAVGKTSSVVVTFEK